jgi:hypothetical protein
MPHKGRLAAILLALTLFGCSSKTSTASASGSASAPADSSAAASPAADQGFRTEPITDPTLKMTAYEVKIPASFKFQGAYVAGTSCVSSPFPVFRAYSADGLKEFRALPRFDWTWNNSPYGNKTGTDCLSIQKELSPQEFIKYLVGVLQVAYVSEASVPPGPAASYQKTLADLNARGGGMHSSGGSAAALVTYKNGSFVIEEQITVTTLCMKTMMNIPGQNWFSENCSAYVNLARAPKGQLTALVNAIDAQSGGASVNQQWSNTYNQTMLNNMVRQNAAIMQQRQVAFEQGQAIRAQQHQQFMAQMQAGTDASMAHAAQVANSNHAIAQDWFDYSLDQQTVTGSGGTAKVSSSYSQTWSNGSQYYQTNNPNTNPNGALSGTWTLQTKVHGDGTPY